VAGHLGVSVIISFLTHAVFARHHLPTDAVNLADYLSFLGNLAEEAQQEAEGEAADQQEGAHFSRSTRSGSDSHLLRYGRSGADDHLLRYGRSGRDVHLLRYGRGSQDGESHLLRFSKRAGQDDQQQQSQARQGRGSDSHLLRFSKRGDHLLRFNKRGDHLLRFSRANNGDSDHLLRFSRGDPHLLRYGRAPGDSDHLLRFSRGDHLLRFSRGDNNHLLRFSKRGGEHLLRFSRAQAARSRDIRADNDHFLRFSRSMGQENRDGPVFGRSLRSPEEISEMQGYDGDNDNNLLSDDDQGLGEEVESRGSKEGLYAALKRFDDQTKRKRSARHKMHLLRYARSLEEEGDALDGEPQGRMARQDVHLLRFN